MNEEIEPRTPPVRARSIEPDYATISYDGVELLRLPLVEESRTLDSSGWDWKVVVSVGPGIEPFTSPAGAWLTLYAKDGGYLKDYVLNGAMSFGGTDKLTVTMMQSYHQYSLHNDHNG